MALLKNAWGWWLQGLAAVIVACLSVAAFAATSGIAWVIANAPIAAVLDGWSLDDAVSLWADLWWAWGPLAAAFASRNLARFTVADIRGK